MTVYERQCPGVDDDLLAEVACAILARAVRDPGIEVSNVGGWHSAPTLLDWEEASIQRVMAAVVDAVAVWCGDARRMQAWATVMRAGAYHLAHRHGDAVWSGVLYVHAGDAGAGGRITFAQRDQARIITPRDGQLLVFPGHLLHSVETYTGTTPRVTVAFNLATSARSSA